MKNTQGWHKLKENWVMLSNWSFMERRWDEKQQPMLFVDTTCVREIMNGGFAISDP